MTNTDENAACGERVELTVKAGIVRSPVDPAQQLGLAGIARLLHERLEQIETQRKQDVEEKERQYREAGSGPPCPGMEGMPSVPVLAFAGNPEEKDVLWENICPACANRTVHVVRFWGVRAKADYREYCICNDFEKCKDMINQISTVDLELSPIGFCAHCCPDVREPSVRLVARFPDPPERELDFRKATNGLYYLRNLSSPGSTLSAWDCQALASWLGIELNRAGKE